LNFYGILRDAPSIYLHGNFDWNWNSNNESNFRV
jgi:hypothetical protein